MKKNCLALFLALVMTASSLVIVPAPARAVSDYAMKAKVYMTGKTRGKSTTSQKSNIPNRKEQNTTRYSTERTPQRRGSEFLPKITLQGR